MLTTASGSGSFALEPESTSVLSQRISSRTRQRVAPLCDLLFNSNDPLNGEIRQEMFKWRHLSQKPASRLEPKDGRPSLIRKNLLEPRDFSLVLYCHPHENQPARIATDEELYKV